MLFLRTKPIDPANAINFRVLPRIPEIEFTNFMCGVGGSLIAAGTGQPLYISTKSLLLFLPEQGNAVETKRNPGANSNAQE